MARTELLIPTGDCWCGCGEKANPGKFWTITHDRYAEAAIIKMHWGTIANFLKDRGYGPGGKNLRQTYEQWKKDN